MKLFTCCWRPQKDVSPALPSVPGEVFQDIMLPLDRWTLDAVQFACRRFLRLITERMSDICLRRIEDASFHATFYGVSAGGAYIGYDCPARYVRKARMDVAPRFSEFMQALHSSHVDSLDLNGLVFTPELAALVLRTPIVTKFLHLNDGSCAALTSTLFHKLVLHFSPTYLSLNRCRLRASQLSDEFLRTLSNVLRIWFREVGPVDGASFFVTDDAIVEFCVHQDVHTDQEMERLEELTLHNGNFTKDLFKRLVEASTVSIRTRPLQITLSPSCVEDEELRDYAQYLTYRTAQWQRRIYNFPCNRHGAVTAMRLQIVLEDEMLILIHARHDSSQFY
ncbi:hypothetical protein AAVH_14524 [Aphelenchoides avenae]|nr:hypothetical protein AAVH_37284 [Aphelenchus avenae]KAH7718013.1 hypothetical protein AAVH_14524 [Aphelenchus avenae]